MKKILRSLFLGVICLGLLTVKGFGQQDPQYSHYMFNTLVYNPGIAGSEMNTVNITALFRNQWLGFSDGTPVTQNIMAHMPIANGNFGLGIHVANDMLGAERATSAALSVSYVIRQNWGNLGFGINGGIAQRQLDGTKLIAPDGDYTGSTPNPNDPFIPVTIQSGIQPDFSFGAYYTYDRLFAGVSLTHLLEPTVEYSTTNSDIVEIPQIRHYYATVGYNAKLKGPWELQPSLLYKTELSKSQLDLNAILTYNGTIWAGAGFRGINNGDNRDAAVAMAGLQVAKNLRLGYSFDITVSQIAGFSSGTHEFMLNYKIIRISAAPPANIIHCPRFL